MPAAPAPGQVDASPWPDSAELLSPGLAVGWPVVHSHVLHPGAGGVASDLAPTVAGEPQTVTGASITSKESQGPHRQAQSSPTLLLYLHYFHFLILLLVFHFKGIYDHILLVKLKT